MGLDYILLHILKKKKIQSLYHSFAKSRLSTICHWKLLPSKCKYCCRLFQVPFIAFYRKEYVEPELNINNLWKIYQWDEKVSI